MRYLYSGTLIFGILFLITGCSNRNMALENDSESMAETIRAESVEAESSSGDDFFPAHYTGGTDKIVFDCSLDIPEEFDADTFCVPKVNGLQYIDQEVAYADYVEGREIQEQYTYPTDDANVPEENVYVMADSGVTVIDSELNYSTETSYIYSGLLPSDENEASRQEFSFGTADDCIDDLTARLESLFYPVEEFWISWFSIGYQEFQELEQAALAEGSITSDRQKESWAEDDNIYVFYGWQTYGGLQVFPQIMTTRMGRAFESYQRAPLSAMYTKDGIVSLVTGTPYDFESSGEPASFMAFSEVAETVIERYDNLLDDVAYTVGRVMLVMRIYYDESQAYCAEPVWYFEVSGDDGGTDVVLVNALTGKEIYLDP